ncbi:organic cation transporter protein-like [Ostrinia furnacalis]|uniref:organic cation transporter protein-like n=1 Tax=Ostrinia furnacalis TaxID=93504 RepID=UPI00103EC1FD|nr:organic cation transporter protein-like [Ostrinia furnacalis]
MTVFTKKDVQEDSVKGLDKFGKYQLVQYFWLCLPLFTVSMMHVNYVFIAEHTEYRCIVPECENRNASIQVPEWWPTDVDAQCERPIFYPDYNTSDQICKNTSIFNFVAKCDQWIYENDNSIISTFNLACQSWKATLVGTIHNAGMMLSMVTTGWISDKVGRKPAMIFCSFGGFVGVFKIFATNFNVYLAIEFLESFIASGLYNVGVILLIEIGGESKRVTAGVLFSYAVYLGEVVFAAISMGFKYWKHVMLAIYSPMVLYISYIFILKESTRWQMIRGKMGEAKSTFKLIARMNKVNISDDEIDVMSDEDMRSKFNVELQKEKENFKDIIGSKAIVTRLVVTAICFFTSSFLYYGLVVNAIYLPGDKYVNFILASVTSFPGDLIAFYCLNKFGRRITLQCGYLTCAVFLIAQTYTPEHIIWLKVLLFLIGKLGVVICFTSIYTYAMELFPTSVRGSLFGFGNTVARVGGMLAPLTPLLTAQFTALPTILFAVTSVLSAFATSFTPETKYLPLFDTIAQINAYKTAESDVNTHL